MELELDGKVAIVTGGSKGIGRATALGFVNEGASVLVCARGREALDETIAAAGHGARTDRSLGG
jgi:3-oxoacyl-[acyl-carrier protein] reductase